jgi:hypothetical protein
MAQVYLVLVLEGWNLARWQILGSKETTFKSAFDPNESLNQKGVFSLGVVFFWNRLTQ